MLNSKELLEQANQRVVTINKIMGEIEDFEGILSAGRTAELSFTEKGIETTYISGVLSAEKMQELKDIVMVAIIKTRDEKTAELEQLLGIKKLPPALNSDFEEKAEPLQIPKRKPATINPEFEAAINDMKSQLKVDKPEITVDGVRRLYLDEGKTLTEVSNYFGVKREMMNSFIRRNGLNRTTYGKNDVFLDSKIEAKRREHP